LFLVFSFFFFFNDTATTEIYTLSLHDALPIFSDRLPGRSPEQERMLSALTERELEVLTAIASGWSNAEIGERLNLAESTVKTHVSHILAKIDARDRVQAVIFAYDTGLVRPA